MLKIFHTAVAQQLKKTNLTLLVSISILTCSKNEKSTLNARDLHIGAIYIYYILEYFDTKHLN